MLGQINFGFSGMEMGESSCCAGGKVVDALKFRVTYELLEEIRGRSSFFAHSIKKLVKIYITLFGLCFTLLSWSQNTTISGSLTDKDSGETLIFASVYVEGTNVGVTTNEYGFFSLTVNQDAIAGDHFIVVCSYLGYPSVKFDVPKVDSFVLNAAMSANTELLGAAEVEAIQSQHKEVINSTQMSSVRIPMKDIGYIPSLGGETDIIKVVQLMPGVQGGGEGGTGMFVRGGDADQNLVLLDEATVYNIGHLFGFFSVFNSDALHDMTMIKGAFPANYGGRLSSILDIRMKDGHNQTIHGTGGIGLLSSRLTLEGPIVKDKSTFLISARRTYIDQVFKLTGQVLPYHFYDLNAKLNYRLGANDRLFFSSYLGNDILRFDGDDVGEEESVFGFGFTLGNVTSTLRWNHIYNDRLFSNLSLIHTKFNYDISGKFDSNNLLIKSDVRDIGLKADYDYYPANGRHIRYGGQIIEHIFKPNVVNTAGEISEFLASREGDQLNNLEWGVYGNAEEDFRDGLFKLSAGVRVSGSFVKDKAYAGIEPRVSGRYSLTEFDALKLSYSRMKQYMHRVSSSSVSLPTDLWYPVTAGVAPQRSDQIAAGYSHLFESIGTYVEFEAYYKWLNNLIEDREGANLILNDNFENDLLQGKGKAYGLEFLVRRDEGKLTGWIAYTLSWATREFEDLNNGKPFWAKYDRRHSVAVVSTYKLSKRWTISAVWVYNSGSRFTAQVGQYLLPNASLTGFEIIPLYTERNAVSMSPSHRLDLNFVLGPRPEKKRKFTSEWHFGGYNIYNRATPYRINIEPADQGIGYKYVQPGLFGFIPSVAYNFSF
jgi:hypothetical protein